MLSPSVVQEFRSKVHRCPIHHLDLIPLKDDRGEPRVWRIGNIEYDELLCVLCYPVWRLNARPVPAELGGNATQAVIFTPEGVR